MSSQSTKRKPRSPLAVEQVGRVPQQGRSKASYERMFAAARTLMLERGDEEFTLIEVSQRGNVSIGSIYLRFESKDNLVRAVICEALEEIVSAEEAMFERLADEASNLGEFVPRYVSEYAEVLRVNAPLLRLAMRRAAFDPLISAPGKQVADRSAAGANRAMLRFADEIGGDAALKADSVYHIIFATLARELHLGSTAESARNYDWEPLKRELARMCLAYLRERA